MREERKFKPGQEVYFLAQFIAKCNKCHGEIEELTPKFIHKGRVRRKLTYETPIWHQKKDCSCAMTDCKCLVRLIDDKSQSPKEILKSTQYEVDITFPYGSEDIETSLSSLGSCYFLETQEEAAKLLQINGPALVLRKPREVYADKESDPLGLLASDMAN